MSQSGATSQQQRVNTYIARLERRLRLRAGLLGAALLALCALLMTLVLVAILNAHGFPLSSLGWARATLIVSLLGTFSAAIVWPLLRLTRAEAIRRAEAAFPQFEDRLVTFAQRATQPADPFIELLAADTAAVAETTQPARLAPAALLTTFLAAAAVSAGLLVWMVMSAPGYLGYGASLLWTGPKTDPLYAIRVAPGDAALRRHTDGLVTAQLTGIVTDQVRLFARYASSTRWEPVNMQATPGSAGYQFVFASLPEDVEYYVAAGPVTTPHFKLRVVDMPRVTGIHVTYHYPAWTGMKPRHEESGGDLRALEGTVAELEVETDRPLNDGLIVEDDGTPLKLTPGQSNHYQASVKMQKDGAYHFAGIDSGQRVRLSEDYFIATNKVDPPEVAIEKPANDYRASPIEEVTVKVKGSAEYGLHALALHYSVNGGAEQIVPLLKAPGVRQADGAETLSLESFKLQPGDVVSLYATAKDGHAESKTEISFIQAEPFEREYSQSQSAGGAGGGGGGQQGGNEQGEISRRQKELIAATWKQANAKGSPAKANDDAAKFLSDVQAKLKQQVVALTTRVESRDLAGSNETFSSFETDMHQAAESMTPATAHLQSMQWPDAIRSEQKALQYLLRAEATFRQIQVAFGNRQGGGGGGGSMGRDLASLLDLELDTQKNQYEQAQTGSAEDQQAKKVDDALAKLDALAKRQQELAQAEQKQPQQTFQQRWQQEMLRREAEQLRREMEQLAQNGQQHGQQSGQSSNLGQSSGSSAQQAQKGASGPAAGSAGSQTAGGQPPASVPAGSRGAPQTAGDPRVQQALSRLREADEQMRRAASPQSGQAGPQAAANESARRAAEQLKQATNLLGGAQQKQASGKLDALAREADRLAAAERAQASRIERFANSQGEASLSTSQSMTERAAERSRLADDRQSLSDDLARLESQLRNAQRELAPAQPGVSSKLRDALGAMDEDELGNRVQRTADWLRRGINPESNGTEAGIRAGLDKLSVAVGKAQQGMEKGEDPRSGKQAGDQVAALDALDRLRSNIESLARPGNGQQGAAQGSRQGNRQSNATGGSTPGRPGSPAGHRGAPGGQTGQQTGDQNGGSRRSGERAATGDLGNSTVSGGGDTRSGGGNEAAAWGNLNTGNNRFDGARRAGDPGSPNNPADTERAIVQATRELGHLRQAAGNDPQAQKEIAELTRQMQQLDPKRFPGNPEMVSHLGSEVLSQVDKLELQLRQSLDQQQGPVRSARSRAAIPTYQDAVADYYRRLSAAQH